MPTYQHPDIKKFFEGEPAAMTVTVERRSVPKAELIGFEIHTRSGKVIPVANEADVERIATLAAEREVEFAEREPDCEESPDGQHHFGFAGDDYADERCTWCDRKPWYRSLTAAGRRALAAEEAAR